MIHDLADVKSTNIGKNTNIWQFVVVLKGAVIGRDCNINCHTFIENDVIIGDRVTIKPGVQIWDGLRISNDVFIGPNVTFVNDKTPRSKQYPDQFLQTQILENASIGANATIIGGLNIGKYAMVGAGSVVTRNVPNRALVVGNPSRIVGWLSEDGTQMQKIDNSKFEDNQGQIWIEHNQTLSKV